MIPGSIVGLIVGDAASDARLLAAGAFVFGLNTVSFLLSAWLIGTTQGRFNDERVEVNEGCLSVPGLHFEISRPKVVTLRGVGVDGSGIDVVSFDDSLDRMRRHVGRVLAGESGHPLLITRGGRAWLSWHTGREGLRIIPLEPEREVSAK